MKTVLPRLSLAFALATISLHDARADMPPPGQQECLDRYLGETCRYGGSGPSGRCVVTTCFKVAGQFGDHSPPVGFPCIRCRPDSVAPKSGQDLTSEEEIRKVQLGGWEPEPFPEGKVVAGQRNFDEPYRSRLLADRALADAAAAAHDREVLRRSLTWQRNVGIAGGALGAWGIAALVMRMKRRRKQPV